LIISTGFWLNQVKLLAKAWTDDQTDPDKVAELEWRKCTLLDFWLGGGADGGII
jgi:hypothetical protein